jgi:hypothetical protein
MDALSASTGFEPLTPRRAVAAAARGDFERDELPVVVELLTATLAASAAAVESAAAAFGWCECTPDPDGEVLVPAVCLAPGDACDADREGEFDAAEPVFGPAVDELDVEVFDSAGAANATPELLARAAPTPSATASAPTRPTYRAAPTATGAVIQEREF